MSDHDLVRISVDLHRQDDAWPPVSAEVLWAQPLGETLFRLVNLPFFAYGLAADDLVRAVPDATGALQFSRVVQASGRSVVRVVPMDDGPMAGDVQGVLDAFAAIGLRGEGGLPSFRLAAIDIPQDADFDAAVRLLLAGHDDGRWEFEEGCVSEAWVSVRRRLLPDP